MQHPSSESDPRGQDWDGPATARCGLRLEGLWQSQLGRVMKANFRKFWMSSAGDLNLTSVPV
jgi:hypothetical protein